MKTPFSKSIDDFVSNSKLSPSTVRAYKNVLIKFAEENEIKDVKEVTFQMLDEFANNGFNSIFTRNMKIIALKKFFNYVFRKSLYKPIVHYFKSEKFKIKFDNLINLLPKNPT